MIGYAGWVAGRPVVTVVHDETRTTYEPVRPAVTVGSRVAAGEVIGHLEEGADHCPAPASTCLHWGLRRGSAYLDPLSLLGPRRLRLLPLSAAAAGPGAPAPVPPAAAASPAPATAAAVAPSGGPASALPPSAPPSRARPAHPGGPADAGGPAPRWLATPAAAGMLAVGAATVVTARRRLRRGGRSWPRSRARAFPMPPDVVDLDLEHTRRRPPLAHDVGSGQDLA